jgi:hypothetical protein
MTYRFAHLRKDPGKAKRAAPETRLQISVKQYLNMCLSDDVLWTASLTGVHLSMQARTRAKAMGVRRGFPDLQFLFPDGVTRYIELKAGASLSPEQRDFRDAAKPHGIWAVCRSVDEVEAQLRSWGAKLRNHPFADAVAA